VVDEYGVVQIGHTQRYLSRNCWRCFLSRLENPQAVQRGWFLVIGWNVADEFLNFSTSTSCVESIEAAIRPWAVLMTHLGRIPAATDHFEWEGMRFEVMDMDGNRVDKVLVMPGQIDSSQRRKTRSQSKGRKALR